MKYSNIKTLALVLAATGLLGASVSPVKAGFSFGGFGGFGGSGSYGSYFTCNQWTQGDASGSQVFTCNFQSQTTGGDYWNSYKCYTQNLTGRNGYCSIQLNSRNSGCQTYQGDCTVVFKCKDGKTYSCNITDWTGCNEIKCENLPWDCKRNCKDIEIICKPKCHTPPPTCVPEPSTIIAGALLLMPLGVSTVRILRKKRVVV